MNKKPKTSVLFILLGGVVVIFMLFPTFLPGADSAFGPVQTGLMLAGFGLIVFGFDLGSQPGEGSMDLWHFIRHQARIFIPWLTGSILYALVIIISPRFFFIQENIKVLKVAALFLFFAGLLQRLAPLFVTIRLRNFFRSILNRTKDLHWGIALIILSILAALYSDILRGSLLAFAFFS